MAGRSGLEALELTGEEVERLRAAFQDEHFRRLFADYAAELADPAQRAIYEAEVVALERERGVEARFLHPTPGWVLRTSQAGTRRCYLNVCSNPLVGRPQARPAAGGSRWDLPHCLSPPREELGRGRRRRLLYDVLFHPDALRLAARSARFRRLLEETALDAVERHFAPGLDRANAAPLRGTQYKGVPQASLLRTPLPGGGPAPAEEEEEEAAAAVPGASPLPPFPAPYAYPPPAAARSPPQPEPAPAPAPAATTPRWTLRHRSYVDLQDYRCSRDSAPGPVPRELEVTVELPLLSAAAQAQLEVRGQELRLDSQRPAAYRLRLRLPYPVDEDGGRAAFDKSKRRLVVTLPVRPKQLPGSGDLPRELGVSPPAGPVAHVGNSHLEPPVCPEESRPAALETPETPAVPRPAPLEVHVVPTPELPVCPETPTSAACDGSHGSDAPETSPGARDKQSHEPGSVSLAPDAGVGNTLELPACRSIAAPSPATQLDFLGGAAMDLKKWPEVSDGLPSSDFGDTTIASTDLCVVTGRSELIPECHRLSYQGQNTEICTSTVVSGHPSCSSNPATPACLDATPSVDLSVTGVGAANSPPHSPLLPRTGLGNDPEAPISSPRSPDSPVPASSPAPPLCPPFQCSQDEEALMLLLQVPGIVPQSLKGEVGTSHYRVSFANKDLVSYLLLLQLPPENKLTSPETSISVSLSNAVIHLTKAPETTGLWTKLYFGQNEDALQERFFVTEDTVDDFLGSLQRPSGCSQPEMDHQPLIEVLNVSEGKSQIQFKAQEHNSPQPGKARETVHPRTEDSLQLLSAENYPLVTDLTGVHATQTKKASDSLSAAETIERAGRGSPHCLELDPADSSSALPGKLQIMKLRESEPAFPADRRATSTKQSQLNGAELGRTGEDVGSGSGENNRLTAPVLRETDMRDGSVQFISHHTTQCAVTFQNPLLYELD